jgi:hypothetical protein
LAVRSAGLFGAKTGLPSSGEIGHNRAWFWAKDELGIRSAWVFTREGGLQTYWLMKHQELQPKFRACNLIDDSGACCRRPTRSGGRWIRRETQGPFMYCAGILLVSCRQGW